MLEVAGRGAGHPARGAAARFRAVFPRRFSAHPQRQWDGPGARDRALDLPRPRGDGRGGQPPSRRLPDYGAAAARRSRRARRSSLTGATGIVRGKRFRSIA